MAKTTFGYCGISYTWRMRNVAALKGSFKEYRVGGGGETDRRTYQIDKFFLLLLLLA